MRFTSGSSCPESREAAQRRQAILDYEQALSDYYRAQRLGYYIHEDTGVRVEVHPHDRPPTHPEAHLDTLTPTGADARERLNDARSRSNSGSDDIVIRYRTCVECDRPVTYYGRESALPDTPRCSRHAPADVTATVVDTE